MLRFQVHWAEFPNLARVNIALLKSLGLLIHAGKALAALLPHDGDDKRHRRTPGIGHYGVNMRVEKFRRGSVDVILRESQKRMISHSDGSLGAAISDHAM